MCVHDVYFLRSTDGLGCDILYIPCKARACNAESVAILKNILITAGSSSTHLRPEALVSSSQAKITHNLTLSGTYRSPTGSRFHGSQLDMRSGKFCVSEHVLYPSPYQSLIIRN